uniref:Uncharacterized protein n=1 Tax=Triticum urartu TaxID=4572 RepID=A0A8R7U633_TRIUA
MVAASPRERSRQGCKKMEKMMVVNKAGGRAQESTKARESPERGRERGLLFSQSLAGAHSVKGRAQQAGG